MPSDVMEARPDRPRRAGPAHRSPGRARLLGLGTAGIVFGKVTSFLDDVLAGHRQRPDRPHRLHPRVGSLPRIYTVVSRRPMRTTEEYRLTVDGMVDEPSALTYQQLAMELPQTELAATSGA